MERLNAAILELAVRVRLTRREADDEPASSLLARIRAEKQRLEAAGEIRKSKPLPKVKPEEMPFALPEGWVWVRVDEIGDVRLGRQRSPQYHSGPNMRPYIRAANITWTGLDLADVMEMDFPPEIFDGYVLRQGDILLNEASGSFYEVGKPVIWNDEIPNCCMQNTVIRVRLFDLRPDFFHLLFRHYAKSGRFGETAKGMSIRHLGAERLARLAIPLPPLAEQQRIVERVEALFALCDGLAGELEEAEAVRQRWAAAVLAGVA